MNILPHIIYSILFSFVLGRKIIKFQKNSPHFLLRFGGGEGTFCTSFLTFWKGYRNLFPFNAKSLLGFSQKKKEK